MINKLDKKVFGIGWAKTGTTTLASVLEELGLNHKTQDFCLLDELMQGKYDKILNCVNEHDSFDDWPWIILYKQLDMAFEGSKFILTIRDNKAWINSYRNMLKNEGEATSYANDIRSFLYNLDFPNVSDEQLIERYEFHIREVKSYFKDRPNDLLIVDWTENDGWKSVCEFLGEEIPDKPFPHANRGIYE